MAGESTLDSGSLGPSAQDEFGKALITEVREATIAWATVDQVMLPQGVISHSFEQLTNTNLTMTAITTGTAEANAGTPVTLVVAARKATAASKALWILQSWISRYASTLNWAVEIPNILARAAADLMDVDAAALWGGHSNTVGSTGVALTLEALRLATVTMRRIMKGAADGAMFFLHPQQLSDVSAVAIGGTGIALNAFVNEQSGVFNVFGDTPDSGVFRAYQGKVVGVDTFVSTNAPDANASVDHAGALLIPKRAYGGAVLWEPKYVTDSQSVNLKLADSHGVSCAYGVVEKQDVAGVTVISLHV